jgi:hypothetical protein
MAKQKAFLLVGLPHSGSDLLLATLEQHRDALAEQKVKLPAKSEDEMFRAAVEIRGEHRAWALRRKDVEGAWSKICRRATATKHTVVVGHELLAGATPDEIALLVDRLPGTALHVVVTVTAPDARVALFPDELDLVSVLQRWAGAVRSRDRVHVLVCDPSDPSVAWQALAEVVGFDAVGLDVVAAPGVVPRIDPATLRLVADAAGSHLTRDDLAELIDEWAKTSADEGYDVRGDLAALTPAPDPDPGDAAEAEAMGRLDVVSDALTEAVAEIGRLREKTAELEHRNAKLDRKRLKFKRRLAEVS